MATQVQEGGLQNKKQKKNENKNKTCIKLDQKRKIPIMY